MWLIIQLLCHLNIHQLKTTRPGFNSSCHGTVYRECSPDRAARRECRSTEPGRCRFVCRSAYLAHLAVRYPGVDPTSPCKQLRVVGNPVSGSNGGPPATHRRAAGRFLQRYKSRSGTELERTRRPSHCRKHSRVQTSTTCRTDSGWSKRN